MTGNLAESDRQAVQLMNIGRDMIAHPNRTIPAEATTAIETAILAYARLVDAYVKAVAA